MSNAKLSLGELIDYLMKTEGLSEAEAIAAARATRNVLARSDQSSASIQGDGRGVDYGEETVEEARERWIAQELNDPNGIFGGGATAGGVFGDGVISTDRMDPGAVMRTLQLQGQLGQIQTQQQMLELLHEMRKELQAARQPAKPERQIGDSRPRRFLPRSLGTKKRRG